MICRRCGTQSQAERCPYCGAELLVQTETQKEEPSIMLNAYQPPVPSRPVQQIPRVKRVSGVRVFFAALALCLPLGYLFFDLYVVLGEALFRLTGEGTSLSLLVGRLFSFEYAGNSFSEIKSLTLGADLPLLELCGPLDLFNGGTEMLLPLLLVSLLCLGSAVLGLLLLFGGNRLLRRRLAVDLVTLFGGGAVISPLLGLLALRVADLAQGGLRLADMNARAVMPSLEALLVLGILVLLVPPAISTLRRAGAAQREELHHVSAPCCLLGAHSFGFAKGMAMLFTACALTVGVLFVILPILLQGTVPPISNSLGALAEDGKVFFTSLISVLRQEGTEVNLLGMIATLKDIVHLVFPVLSVLLMLLTLPVLSSIRSAKRHTLCTKRRQCRSLVCAGEHIRSLIMLPYVLHIVAQGLLLLLLSMCSGLVLHLDLGVVDGTTEQLYLLVGYVRTLCGVNTLYALLAAGGAICGTVAEQYCLKMIVLSHKQGEKRD